MGRQTLERIKPTKYTIGNQQIRNPEGVDNLIKTEQSIEKAEELETRKDEVAIAALETIFEDKEKEQEHSIRTKERMMITVADLFENKGKLTVNTLVRLQKSDKFCAKTRNLLETGKIQPSFKILTS